jgi:hypothetical protein
MFTEFCTRERQLLLTAKRIYLLERLPIRVKRVFKCRFTDFSANIKSVTAQWNLILVKHIDIARMGKKRGVYSVLVRKTEGKRPL